jgi:aspartyl-tRNA(Asn)/glutamyl-tRNA(Gln) amidotransferase subunit A
MPELWELTAEEISRRVAGGELSAGQVLEACLERTRQVEPRVHGYLTVLAEEGRAQAAEIDRRLAAGGEVGRLPGVPVALKDNLNLEGSPLTCASKILQGHVSSYTASAVARLATAGAVVVGKTNMDEFAMGSSCENSAFGVTHNPWHLGCVPGGSSGGSAAAVAAGSVPLALGSDTGGSIRQPAAFCGVVGLKPTYGRVSRYGLVAFASSTDQVGPIARTVRDAALALTLMAGPDPRDATCSARPTEDFLAHLEEGIQGLRVGFVQEVEKADPPKEVRQNWERSLGLLEELGAELVPVSIPTLQAAIAVYYVLANSEASANLARFDGVRYGRRAKAPESLVELYFRSRTEGLGTEVKRRIMLGTFALSAGYYEAYYDRALRVLEVMRRQFEEAFQQTDVLVTPTSPTAAFRIGERTEDPLAMYLCDVYTTPASLVGLPAVAVPSGSDSRGLPFSLQIMAPHFAEATALRVARAFEQRVGWEVAPAFRGH